MQQLLPPPPPPPQQNNSINRTPSLLELAPYMPQQQTMHYLAPPPEVLPPKYPHLYFSNQT
jgi:hypothetical protein